MVSCTVAAVRNGNDDISVEPDALEIISGISREQSGEYGIEIDAELASVWGIGQKLMKLIGKLPFLQLERPPDFTEEMASDSLRALLPYTYPSISTPRE